MQLYGPEVRYCHAAALKNLSTGDGERWDVRASNRLLDRIVDWLHGHQPLQFLGLGYRRCRLLTFCTGYRLRWNLSLEDPDMSMAQMIRAVSIVVMTAYFVNEYKPVVVLSGLAFIVVGANRLTKRELLIFAVYAMVAYVVSVSYKAQHAPLSWVTELVVMIAFALVVVFGPLLYRFEMTMVKTCWLIKMKSYPLR